MVVGRRRVLASHRSQGAIPGTRQHVDAADAELRHAADDASQCGNACGAAGSGDADTRARSRRMGQPPAHRSLGRDAPLVRSRIRTAGGILDPTHIRLDSAARVEPGTILSLADAGGNPIDAPMKVAAIDLHDDSLITLAAAIPAAAMAGSPIVSLEFRLNVYLLRQPDPALPSRNTQTMDFEVFPLRCRSTRAIAATSTKWSARPGPRPRPPGPTTAASRCASPTTARRAARNTSACAT